MSDPFIGEIRMFGGNFAPLNWSFCNGDLIAISQNDTLFTLIGTTYGGDGQETFALPNLYGRIPIHQGQGPGLSSRIIGESSGTETVTLSPNQVPVHTHGFLSDTNAAAGLTPQNSFLATGNSDIYTTDTSTPSAMNPGAITISGGSQPHDNMMPFLAVNFIISLYGIFPSRA
mgnify:CR=1 FL=1